MEVTQGAENKLDQKLVANFMASFPFVYPTQEDIDWAIKQLSAYRLSHNVGMNDCLIAAPCHRLQLPLYTQNLKHFAPLLGALAQQRY